MSFEALKYDSDYEIEKEFPHRIRRIGIDMFISEWKNNSGYICVAIKQKQVLKHRLLALQFIENDSIETKTQVDHINRIKTDNRLQNLRWVTPSENSKNCNKYKTRKYEYLDEFPELTIEIAEYNGYHFDDYHYDLEYNRIIKQQNTGKIKVIKPYVDGNAMKICLYDITRKCRQFHYNKLIRSMRDIFQEQEDEIQNIDAD